MMSSSRAMFLFVFGATIAYAFPALVGASSFPVPDTAMRRDAPTQPDQGDQEAARSATTLSENKVVQIDGSSGGSPSLDRQHSETPDGARIMPRLELFVPSIHKLVSETQRSRSGVFVRHVSDLLLEMASGSSEGVSRDEALAVIEQLRRWPDTSVSAATFAPDAQGRPRWAVRVDWPLDDLHDRLDALLKSEAAKELFYGVNLRPAQAGYELRLDEIVLAYLLPDGDGRSLLAADTDLFVPPDGSDGDSPEGAKSASLLTCRLDLTATEPDSGATFLSSFSAVTGVDYSSRVNDEGEWIESVRIHWPPISGLGAKALFGSVKQTFFVPHEAFGAVAINSKMIPGMLDTLAGFGPEVMFEEGGALNIVGEVGPGPIVHRARSQVCATLLPGTGFLPMPDIVIQSRTRRPNRFIDEVRSAVERTNEVYRARERREPWHEITVRQHPVFWRDGSSRSAAVIMPLVLKPVVFTTREIDARGRERDFIVVAWTSTTPDDFVRRWLGFPRDRKNRHLPSQRKMNGELWIHWQQVYRWVHPYLDLGLSMISTDVLFPRAGAVASDLTDARITADLKYAGLTFRHRGPVPLGVLVVPSLIDVSLAPDETGGSDVARERLACQRLRVLYHHCKLFRGDLGRWPAEVAELDGYVDFQGRPDLLELRLSAKKRWGDWFNELLESPEEDEEEDEDENELDTDLYVIDWGSKRWSLGYAPQTFEHLERLYIDQDGKIHRVERKVKQEAATSEVPGSQEDGASKDGGKADVAKE